MYRYLIIFCLLFGFLVGHMSARRTDKKEVMEKTLQLEKILNEIRSAQTTIEKTNAIIAMDKTEEYYAPTGKISKRVTTKSHQIFVQKKASHLEEINKIEMQKTFESEIKTLIAPEVKKNYLVGVQLSTEDALKLQYKAPELTLGYRLVGSVYATATSDIAFKNPKIGLTITF